jgi:hypothetical protein
MYRTTTILFVLGMALGVTAGCLQEDPDHCANRGGDSACEAAQIGEHCSRCKQANWGCRSSPDPDPDCRVSDQDGAWAEADTEALDWDGETGGRP